MSSSLTVWMWLFLDDLVALYSSCSSTFPYGHHEWRQLTRDSLSGSQVSSSKNRHSVPALSDKHGHESSPCVRTSSRQGRRSLSHSGHGNKYSLSSLGGVKRNMQTNCGPFLPTRFRKQPSMWLAIRAMNGNDFQYLQSLYAPSVSLRHNPFEPIIHSLKSHDLWCHDVMNSRPIIILHQMVLSYVHTIEGHLPGSTALLLYFM